MAENAEIFVAIDAGADTSLTDISPSGELLLRSAVEYLNDDRRHGTKYLAFCNADLPQLGMREENSSKWKRAVIKRHLDSEMRLRILEYPAKVSVDEAENLKRKLEEGGIAPRKIKLFCDRWHAPSLRIIWESVFPGTDIEIIKIRCRWNQDHLLRYMKSERVWLVHNWKRYFALRLMGVEWTAAMGKRIQEKQG